MRRKLATAAMVIAALVVGGCAGGDDNGDDATAGGDDSVAEGSVAKDADVPVEAAEGQDDAAVAPAARVDPNPRQVIHHVDLTIDVDDVAGAAQRAATYAQTSGGFVAAESTDGDESATLTLRVPADGHTEIVDRLEELGEVRERHRDAQDVTEEVVDVEARIASQRRSIDRIRVLLDQAADLDDVVKIESELSRREADLDSLLQRQEELAGLTSLATVTVTFVGDGTEPSDEEEDPGFLSGLGAGWDAFVSTANVAAAIIGAILPFAIVAALVGGPIWWGMRRRRQTATPAAAIPGDHA